MKLTKFFVSLAAIAIVTEVTRRIVTDNNAQSGWDVWPDDWDEEDDDMFNYQPKKTFNIAEEARKKARKALLLEQDYELASLYDAIQTQDEAEQKRSKARLAEITSELEALK